MKFILSNLFLISFFFTSKAFPVELFQNFEGKITIVQTNVVDTINYEFTVKDQLIRIKQTDSKGNLRKHFIVNLQDSTVFEINDYRKIFIKYSLQKTTAFKSDQKNVEIVKSENFKYINGYKCYQWLVTNRMNNTRVSYWVAKEEFSYLVNILQAIDRSDKKCSYFMFIPDYTDFFPFQSVERGLLREFRTQDQITSIKEEKVPDNYFTIPKDYHEMHK